MFSRRNGTLVLQVADNGVGMRSTTAVAHQGMRNMRERIERLGGELTVETGDGTGTTIVATVPAASEAGR